MQIMISKSAGRERKRDPRDEQMIFFSTHVSSLDVVVVVVDDFLLN